MTDAQESDDVAVDETLEIIGQSIISELAEAAREHNVTISMYIAPNAGEENEDEVRDPNDR